MSSKKQNLIRVLSLFLILLLVIMEVLFVQSYFSGMNEFSRTGIAMALPVPLIALTLLGISFNAGERIILNSLFLSFLCVVQLASLYSHQGFELKEVPVSVIIFSLTLAIGYISKDLGKKFLKGERVLHPGSIVFYAIATFSLIYSLFSGPLSSKKMSILSEFIQLLILLLIFKDYLSDNRLENNSESNQEESFREDFPIEEQRVETESEIKDSSEN